MFRKPTFSFSTYIWVLVPALFMLLSSCKKDSDKDNNPSGNTQYALIITNGAQGTELSKSISYEARIVSTAGENLAVSGVNWSSSEPSVVTFAGNVAAGVGIGSTVVSARITYQGKEYSAQAPLAIHAPSGVFVVNPWAILWVADGQEFPLTPVYFGVGTPNFTFSSSDASVATVTSDGTVKVLKIGSCNITVTASGLANQPSVSVPVLIVGIPDAPLPVVRILVRPAQPRGDIMFRSEPQTFTARAYTASGQEATGKTFRWWIVASDSLEDGVVATVDQSGRVTPRRVGEATLYAESDAIIGQCNITVNPDTAIIVEPFVWTMGAGDTKRFQAKTYRVTDRTAFRNGSSGAVSLIPNHPNTTWEDPLASFPPFNILELLSQNKDEANIRMKSGTVVGLSSFIVAYVNGTGIAEGGALINSEISFPCECGTDNPQIVSIEANPTNYNLSLINPLPTRITATAKNALGGNVVGAQLRFCSNSATVVIVDETTGEMTPVAPGSAKVKICAGDVSTTVDVTVSF